MQHPNQLPHTVLVQQIHTHINQKSFHLDKNTKNTNTKSVQIITTILIYKYVSSDLAVFVLVERFHEVEVLNAFSEDLHRLVHLVLRRA